ncbi:tape measure protein [Pseudomonas sp. SP16.1]|uniref:tape measure protein n=1 Tax=Pseudomonas sp. SP16.1 TaxID=3458854 RepID=UPI004045AF06
MTDIELRLTADLDQATKEVAGFTKAYADLVKQVEKPLRQVNATRELEANLEATGAQMRTVKQRLQDLQRDLVATDRPTEQLKQSFRDATKELQRLERVEAQQTSQLGRLRTELKGAGVDTTRLAAEQRRLNAELNSAMSAGRADAAARGIRNRAAALKEQALAQRQANLEAARNNLGVTQSRAARLEIQSLRQQYNLLRTSGALTTKELALAQRELKRRIKETKDELSGLEGGFGGGGLLGSFRGGGGAAAVAAGVAAVGAGAVKVAQGADEVSRLDARLRLATKSQSEFNTAQAELDRIADATQGDIAGLVDLYSRLQRPLSEVGLGQKETLQTVEAVSLALKIGGASATEADGAVRQLSQALASGVLRGDEFNSVLEQSDRVAGALADELGVTVGQLREMAKEGKLTTETIVQAFGNQLPTLREEYSKFAPELGAAFDRLLTETRRYWGRQAKESGITDYLAKTVNDMAKNANRATEVEAAAHEELDALRQEELRKYSAYVADLETQRQKLVKDAEAAAKKLVSAEKKATSDLEKVRGERLKIEKRYQEALAGLGGSGDASYSAAQDLKLGARDALANGDVEGAQRLAQEALKMLQDLASAGENTYGFRGFVQELQAIELAANDLEQSNAEDKLADIQYQMKALKDQADQLKDMSVSVKTDEASVEQVRSQIESLVAQLGQTEIVLPVRVQMPDGAPVPTTTASVPGFASGGYTGPGGRYEPAGVVHRGEVVWSQLDIARAGGVAVVEAMRRGLRGYDMGGIVAPRALPAIPSLAPALQQQLAGPNFPDLGSLQLDLGGQTTTVYVDQAGALNLQRLAMKKGGTRRK